MLSKYLFYLKYNKKNSEYGEQCGRKVEKSKSIKNKQKLEV